MAKFTRNPWLEIQAMKDEIGKMMEEIRNDDPSVHFARERQAHFKPVADVYETCDSYVIEVELAGLERDAVSIEVIGHELVIYGERRHEKDVGGSAYHILERSYGPFARRFDLPQDADTSAIKAVMQQGIVCVTLPKHARKQDGRRIQVQEE